MKKSIDKEMLLGFFVLFWFVYLLIFFNVPVTSKYSWLKFVAMQTIKESKDIKFYASIILLVRFSINVFLRTIFLLDFTDPK